MTNDDILKELQRRLTQEEQLRSSSPTSLIGNYRDGRVQILREMITDMRWKVVREAQQCNKSES